MSWKVQWCKGSSVRSETVETKAEALAKLAALDDSGFTDARITRDPPPTNCGGEYHNITERLSKRKLIPFLGAGASLSARPNGAKFSEDENFPPSAAELAELLAFSCGLPAWFLSDTQNLSRVASYYDLTTHVARRSPDEPSELQRELAVAFSHEGMPGKVHEFLARHSEHLPVIVTTNYDTLIEEALIKARKQFDKVVHLPPQSASAGKVFLQKYRLTKNDSISVVESKEENPENLQDVIDCNQGPLVYKMHGSVDSRAFVITEEDYVRFLSRLGHGSAIVPDALSRQFKQSSFLFLGYGLEDWNFRVILENLHVDDAREESPVQPRDAVQATGGAILRSKYGIGSELSGHKHLEAVIDKRSHWAVQLKPTSVDMRIWRTRRVEIIDMDLNDFINDLEQRWAIRRRQQWV